MSSDLYSVIPVLREYLKNTAWEFYVDYLGFTLDWAERMEDGGPIYAQISRDDVVLHISGRSDDGTPGTVILIRMKGIDAFLKELNQKKYPFAKPVITDMPWNARVMEVTDPFGNRIRFSEKKL